MVTHEQRFWRSETEDLAYHAEQFAADRSSKPSNLTCCCCGESTKGRQWRNRDTSFGLCAKCAKWIKNRRPFGRAPITAEEMLQNYGEAGVHYDLV